MVCWNVTQSILPIYKTGSVRHSIHLAQLIIRLICSGASLDTHTGILYFNILTGS